MSGRLTLYHGENILVTREYSGNTMRDAYLEQYRKIYGKGFSKIRVVDEPHQAIPRVEYKYKKRLPSYEAKKILSERKNIKDK